MAITGGHGVAAASGTTTLSPSWSSTPLVGSLLLMSISTARTSSLAYFGQGSGAASGASNISGWTAFGPTTLVGYGTRALATYFRIADGTASDSPTGIGAYTASGGSTLISQTAAVLMVELQDNVIGGTHCDGLWDIPGTQGITGSPAAGHIGSSTGVQATSGASGTTLTLATGTGWSETFVDAAIVAFGVTYSTYSGTTPLSGMTTQATSPAASGTGLDAIGVVATTSATNISTTATLTAGGVQNLELFVIGFSPTIYPTQTLSAGARVQANPATTIAAGGQISPNAIYGSATLAAGAHILAVTTNPLTAGGRVATPGSATLAAGGAVQGPWSPKILMGTGNMLAEALGSQYLILSGDIDGGDATSHLAGSASPFTYVIDGGQASD